MNAGFMWRGRLSGERKPGNEGITSVLAGQDDVSPHKVSCAFGEVMARAVLHCRQASRGFRL